MNYHVHVLTIKHSIMPIEIIKAHIEISDHVSDSDKQPARDTVAKRNHTIKIKSQALSDI